MAGQQRTTGLLRILLMVGEMVLLLGMFRTTRTRHSAELVTELSQAAGVLMAYPDFESAAPRQEGILLTYADGSTQTLKADDSLSALREGGSVRYTWKTDGDVYFILRGVAQVGEGYVFSRDATLTIPGGIRTIERVESPVTGYGCYHLTSGVSGQ